MKATPDQIRRRFDSDVERFSNLDTGQTSTIDARLSLELIAEAAAATNPQAGSLLDVGCGAGNYTLKLLQTLPGLEVTLLDLSRPMLDRARDRIATQATRPVAAIQGDIRDVALEESCFDLIVSGGALHHLRVEAEWRSVFQKFHRSLRTGGSLWIVDFISHSIPAVQALMWNRYGEYLRQLKGEKYRDEVFAYIQFEDTPRPLLVQTDLLRETGYSQVEVLHKNSCFAAFGATK